MENSFAKENIFGLGNPNTGFAQYFIGNSYLNFLGRADEAGVSFFNVTFEPGCRNNWHIHHAAKGGGLVLLCVAGVGLVSGGGQAGPKSHARHDGRDPAEREALARREKGQLVCAHRGRDPRRKRFERMVRAGGRRKL